MAGDYLLYYSKSQASSFELTRVRIIDLVKTLEYLRKFLLLHPDAFVLDRKGELVLPGALAGHPYVASPFAELKRVGKEVLEHPKLHELLQ